MFALPAGTSVVPAYQEAWGGAVLLRVTLQTHGRWGSPAHQMQWMGRETPREQQALPSAIIRRGSPLGTTEPLVHVRWMKETNEGMEFRIIQFLLLFIWCLEMPRVLKIVFGTPWQSSDMVPLSSVPKGS